MSSIRVAQRLSFHGVLVFFIIVAALWIAEPWLWTPTIYTRCAAATLPVLFPWLALRWAEMVHASSRKKMCEQVEQLCRTDLHEMGHSGDSVWTGQIDEQDPVTVQVRNTMLEYSRRFDELEQARQGADLRVRRATAERDQLTEVFRGLAEPIVAVDAYGQVLLTNAAFLELFSLQAQATEGKPLATVIACEPLVETVEATRRRRGITARTTEACIVDPEGKSRWYRVTCRPITDASAGSELHSGAVAVLSDITPQKLIQQRNAEFVAAVSHEMKTPLSSIKAYVELLADGEAEDDATREEFLGVINGQTDRLRRLIDNLLNLARIEAGVVSVNKESQSLNQVLQEAIEVLRPAAEQKKITLVSDLSPLYLGVLADRDTLLQAIINLLSNAVKYTRDGGQVTIRSRSLEGSVEFEVQDTGVGLSEEDTAKVFEKFYRVKKDKDMAAGTGLGLPLVKHIVEDIHSGRIEVRSVLGTGSTFSVQLPQIRITG